MSFTWEDAFSQGDLSWSSVDSFSNPIELTTLEDLKRYLDIVQVKFCLLRPFFENSEYPMVEHRDLLPSFDLDLLEYKDLPGFSMVAFARQLESFNEVFQYDILHSPNDVQDASKRECVRQETLCNTKNFQVLHSRLPKKFQESFREKAQQSKVVTLSAYPMILPYLCNMDRAHVFSLDTQNKFFLAGVYASFPSDMDGEVKRFGLKTRKFRLDDNELYEKNRLFVYQFLMELYGFPMASERRTSAALFSRRLHKTGEHFMVRVLGNSDRVITTIWNTGGNRYYPMVEKTALIQVDPGQKEIIKKLEEGGFFVDKQKHIIIIRITYKQHRYNADNIRQERALSVESQEVIHPLNGTSLNNINIIKDTETMLVHLNDIVRGEYIGKIVYKRNEIVENTETEEKRFKFLYAWLSKNQRRVISYSDDFYCSAMKILETYLHSVKGSNGPSNDLYQEVVNKCAYIRQARMVKILEDIKSRKYKGKRIGYNEMLMEAVLLIRELQFDLVNYFDEITGNVISYLESMLNDNYLCRKYIDVPKEKLTPAGQSIRKNYGRLVSLHDAFVTMRDSRKED